MKMCSFFIRFQLKTFFTIGILTYSFKIGEKLAIYSGHILTYLVLEGYIEATVFQLSV